MKFVHRNLSHTFHQLLVLYFKKLVSLAAGEFPQSASHIVKRDLKFLLKNYFVQREIVARWKLEYFSVDLTAKQPLNEISF